MSENKKLKFGDLPESKEKQYVQEAGIKPKFQVTAREFIERAEKDGKTKNAQIKITFSNDTHTFVAYLFESAWREEDVKYCGDLYENGVKIRKRTPAEQIEADIYERYYFFEQLIRALGMDKIAIDLFKKGLDDNPDGILKKMFESFVNVVSDQKLKEKFINFKLMWNNNEKAKTSFLTMCKPSASNVIFSPYINDQNLVLQLSNYEQKHQSRMFKPTERVAPAGDGPEGTKEDWVPPSTENGEEPELF